MSKTAVAFDGHYCTDFIVNPDRIIELTNQPQLASRIHLKVAIKNKKGDKEDKRDFNFYNAGTVMEGQGPGGVGLSVRCNGCDDSMNVLYELLRIVRSSSTVPSIDLAASVPGKYFSNRLSRSGDYLEVKTDGTFYLHLDPRDVTGTKPLTGTYTVQGTIIKFDAKGEYQYYLRGVRPGEHHELIVRGGTTFLRAFSFGKPKSYDDYWGKQP